ncbi:NADH dehydrogenase [ubiquinone] 1 alpha subcomplex subunit 6-like [Saccostrea cucullata]|uniref:NADH dehydrogenase [ubiquinone] 1 alpha subcomplex subunit 6-like n=1 Tax=Saccostrea cuccullata TaxID=36930 RepID=UPI002ED2803E
MARTVNNRQVVVVTIGNSLEGVLVFKSVAKFKLDVTEQEAYAKLREEFIKNKHVTDLRVVDLLVVKGQLALLDAVEDFSQKTHLMKYFKDTHNPRPTDFLGKFYAGHDP